jgi:hypothetical protein
MGLTRQNRRPTIGAVARGAVLAVVLALTACSADGRGAVTPTTTTSPAVDATSPPPSDPTTPTTPTTDGGRDLTTTTTIEGNVIGF